jgi:hypothetical protein
MVEAKSDRKRSESPLETMRVPPFFQGKREELKQLAGYLEVEGRTIDWALDKLSYHRIPFQRCRTPVAAGFSRSSLEDAEMGGFEDFDLHGKFGDPRNNRLYTVEGTSMIDVGIEPGDLLVVEPISYPQIRPKSGAIVLACLNDYVTVKEYRRRGDQEFLVPHNTSDPSLTEQAITKGKDEFTIYGVVKSLVRDFPLNSW